MRVDRRIRIFAAAAVIGFATCAVGFVASPAFASDDCQGSARSDAVHANLSETSLAMAMSPPSDPEGCLSLRLDIEHEEASTGTSTGSCGSSCTLATGSVSAEVRLQQEARDPVSSEQEPPLLSTDASQQIEQCFTAGSRTGTVCAAPERRTPTADADPDPDPEPDEDHLARTITLQPDRDEAKPHEAVRFFGEVGGKDACAVGRVELLAKRGGDSGFHRFRTTTSFADGTFNFEVVVGNATEFRAVALGDEACEEAASQVVVLRSRR